MRECENLIHPFQHDPGVSQRQRVLEDLLSGSADIDGRTLADLLDYFMQLSRHIKFYEEDLSVHDWQPFFKKSLPFTVASITKFNGDSIHENLAFYHQLFQKNPSSSGLQLLVHFLYYRLINPLNTWQMQTQGSELPVAFALEKLIKDKLQLPVKEFIKYTNAAVKWYCIKPVDWQRLQENEVWDLYPSDLYESDESFKTGASTQRDRTIALYDAIRGLSPAFLNVMRLVADAAATSMDQSLIPLKAELREQHQPHLAVLFAFLKLFQHLQSDLNRFTKKHLDFFYKQVLRLESRDATPDQAHIIFEIQKQLDSYLLEKGLQVKDGKDDNKAEVLFELDDEIVVNKAQVADKRTLFLNNQAVSDTTCVEGVYMAPDAGKADGIDKDFPEGGPQSFATLGGKYSKYTDPEHGFIKPYPSARLGFILASPVLLLNEGKRTVEITLACELKDDLCGEIKVSAGGSSSCCDDNGEEESETFIAYPSFAASKEFYDQVKDSLNQIYYYINRDLVAQAVKKGVSKSTVDKLNNLLIVQPEEGEEEKKLCYCPREERLYEITTPENDFKDEFSTDELTILNDLFPPRKALSVLFSGEKEWLAPSDPVDISLAPNALPVSGKFVITITATLEADKPAITFYDKEQLKENFDTSRPLVKIELDDKIKIEPPSDDEEENGDSYSKECCLEKGDASEPDVSLYHFFRNVIINDTTIDVEVCGLKNFVVQNDESVQDVNSPIYPFGTRPEVIGFDVVNPREGSDKNLVGPNFYIGSEEILLKKWEQICINLNWENKPANFNDYYKGYLVRDNFHTCEDREDNTHEVYGLNECDFEVNLALLENGNWHKELSTSSNVERLNDVTNDWNRELFTKGSCDKICTQTESITYSFFIEHTNFDGSRTFGDLQTELTEYRKDSRAGFLRFNLQNQDFLHKDYSFVLARQMMAFGRYPSLINDAVYIEGGVPQVFDISIFFGNIGPKIIDIAEDVVNSAIDGILDELVQIISDKIDEATNSALLEGIIERCKTLLDDLVAIASFSLGDLFSGPFDITSLPASEQDQLNTLVKTFVEDLFDLLETNLAGIEDDLKEVIRDKFDDILDTIDTDGIFSGFFGEKEVVIPNEPWTPIISEISLDYSARAAIEDVDLIHLYPYEGTYKSEELESNPTLLPTFCDEGTLFLGLKDLVPGSNVNMLFQLAEATADSESEREDLYWFYLDNNQWKLLRDGFEVLDDATDGLTASGIVKFALPANMTSDNTILPTGLHWIKAAIPQNSRSVSETIGIHTQAVRVTFTNEEANDKTRLAEALPAGSIAKLKEADASVKKVNQPYEGFGGRLPEASGHFYVRTSELLRHKGRSIQKFDYERLALEAFPKLFKVKCINHSFGLNAHKYFNDFPVAPGYVLLAVIPDLNQLKASATFEPRAPVSLLEKVRDYLRRRTSPFVRLKIMNPRYEKVHFCLKVKLYLGRDENFYKEKLRQDLREFLAPWAVGQYEKLTFGQCIYRSDIVRFLETRDYLDYILELKMIHDRETGPPVDQQKVCPVTPRSIVIAGDIDICIQQQDCESWDKCYEHNREVDCCDHETITVADYCEEPVIE